MLTSADNIGSCVESDVILRRASSPSKDPTTLWTTDAVEKVATLSKPEKKSVAVRDAAAVWSGGTSENSPAFHRRGKPQMMKPRPVGTPERRAPSHPGNRPNNVRALRNHGRSRRFK